MSRNFVVFLGVGFAIIGALIVLTLLGTRGARLSLEGKILKVRTMATDDNNSIVVIDFRIHNTAASTPFVIKDATVTVTTGDGKDVEGMTVARRDMDRIFEAYKLIGPKFNQSLIPSDRVAGDQTIDRMIASAIPLPESAVEQRRNLRVRFVELDGATSEISENPAVK
ncbi:MAG TPA: hypothetical protein VFA28_12925 [Bryobacteraceae bacterium]|jgi:hypothetical protein|nr:hypothetical protein [Bryobacteraceae bacterium]